MQRERGEAGEIFMGGGIVEHQLAMGAHCTIATTLLKCTYKICGECIQIKKEYRRLPSQESGIQAWPVRRQV